MPWKYTRKYLQMDLNHAQLNEKLSVAKKS